MNDTNLGLTIASASNNHTFTLSWLGTLAKARQHSATVYNDQANSFTASFLQSFFAGASNIEFKDPSTPTKKFTFDASNISSSTTRTVNIPDANSTTAQAKSSVSHFFFTAMSAQGVFSTAQPASSDLSDASNIPLLNAANAFSNTGTNSFAGNVGIGTASAADRLVVLGGNVANYELEFGNGTLGGSSFNSIVSYDRSGGGAYRDLRLITDSGNDTLRLKAGGVIRFGAYGAGVLQTNASGDISAATLLWSQIDKTTSSLADITTRSASDLSSGTLSAARLPTSVPTSIVNDTNVTGSITSNVLTLAWSGTLAKARQHSATVYNDQANTYSASNLQSFFAGSANIEFRDPSTPTKKFTFDASNISSSTTRTVNIPDANSTTAQTKTSTSHQWLTSMSAQGLFAASQPACADISDAAAFCSGTDAASLTGTLSAARLPTSVPTSIVNDTNVTGSITSNVLTLAWSGTLAKARQHSATVYNDQANTYSASNLQSFFAGSANIEFRDPSTPTKKFTFDASNISSSTTRTVNIPDANSTTAQAKTSTTSQWLTSMSAQGVFSASQPAFTDISGSLACSQTPALTGNVTTSAGSCATTIAAGVVTSSMLASTTGTGTSVLLGNQAVSTSSSPSFSTVTTTAGVSAIVMTATASGTYDSSNVIRFNKADATRLGYFGRPATNDPSWSWTAENASATITITATTGGVILNNGATSWSAVSDERAKVMSEWRPFTGAADKLFTLRAGETRYKTDPIDKQRSFLIAQDVQKILPEAVTTDPHSGLLNLSYTDVVPLMTAAVNEHTQAIRNLESRRESGPRFLYLVAGVALLSLLLNFVQLWKGRNQ